MSISATIRYSTPLDPNTQSIKILRGLRTLINLLPPPFMVFLSILSLQLGAATAKTLFVSFSATTIVFLRVGFAAMALWIIARPQVRQYSRQQWCYAAFLGIVIAAMNMAFYASIARLPLGIAVTIEFLGPLAVAVVGSRKVSDFVWPLLALGGILLLTPIGSLASFDMFGMVFAFGAAVGWAAYIILTAQTSAMFPGTTGLALAMTIGALAMLPAGILSSGGTLLNPSLLFKGFLVAMLSTTIPFSLEFLALKRIPPRMFGILVSSEPAIAALVGFVMLNEYLGVREWIALALVSIATVGVTLYSKKHRK